MSSFNEKVIMEEAMVFGNQICYAEKQEMEIKKLFDTRYHMYDSLYQHRVTQAYECLLLDILRETDGHLYNYLEAIQDPEQYIQLDDSIIHEVRTSDEPELEKAR